MNHLKLIALKDFPLILVDDDLSSIITESIINNELAIDSGDVVVMAQKVVSKSENRYIDLSDITALEEAKSLGARLRRDPRFMQIILNESNKIISTDKNVIIVEHKLGFININAGIDKSNIPSHDTRFLLLPDNPSKSAKQIQSSISKSFNKDVSVIITDSMTRPYRSGVTNFALASSNIQSLIDLKGETDIYGNILQSTEIAVADELAAAAGLLMGQGKEGKPIIIIKGFNKDKYAKNDAFDLIVNEKDDLYR